MWTMEEPGYNPEWLRRCMLTLKRDCVIIILVEVVISSVCRSELGFSKL